MNKQLSCEKAVGAQKKLPTSSCYRALCKAVLTRAILDVSDEVQRMFDEDLKGMSDEDKFRNIALFLYRGKGRRFSIDTIWLDYLGISAEEFVEKFPMYSVTDYRAFPDLPSGLARSMSTVHVDLAPNLDAQVAHGKVFPAITVPTQYSGVVSYDIRDKLPDDQRLCVSVKQFPLIIGDSRKTADLVDLILRG